MWQPDWALVSLWQGGSSLNWVKWRSADTADLHMLCPRPSILQLNTEGLTTSKISVIEQLTYKNKTFFIVPQQTHCTIAHKLVIPNFSLSGSVLSRKHGLATFVRERLEWSLVDQSLNQACPTFVVLWSTFTWGNLLWATNVFCDITISYCNVTNPLILINFMR